MTFPNPRIGGLAVATSDEPFPFTLWRDPTRPIGNSAIRRLREALERVWIPHEPLWRAALGVDAAAAVGIGLRNRAPGRGGDLGMLDLAMSAVLLHAARGDPTAPAVLELGRRSLRPSDAHVGPNHLGEEALPTTSPRSSSPATSGARAAASDLSLREPSA